MDEQPSFGELLRRHRVTAALTQEQLAERAGLSARAITDLERGVRRFPYTDTIRRLTEALRLGNHDRSELHAAGKRVPTTPAQHAPEWRGNLPARLRPLVGRELDIKQVGQQLLNAERGMLTLTGAGGVGKTSLALAAATNVAEQFSGGTCLIQLAPLADGAQVQIAIASRLGIRQMPGRTVLESVLQWLGNRQLLLVLDNCEHVLEYCAGTVDAILTACPDVRILATSREPLRVLGEVTWRVPSLAIAQPSSQLTIDTLANVPAVRLFLERARAVQSEFALTPNNADSVARIVRNLDGIPLAIELAAARVRVLSPGQILDRLSEPFVLLTGGSRTAPSRQQTLQAALEWSYDLLAEEERILFRRFAVFAGGFDLAAAEAVGDTPELLEILTRLVDKSLVIAEEQTGSVRYRLLEPIRQYACALLTATGELETIAYRHAQHYLALAEDAEPKLLGAEQAAWYRQLEREVNNFRAALAWSHSDPSRAHTGLRLANALGWFWTYHDHYSEGRDWAERFLEAAPAPPGARAWALSWAGRCAIWQGDYAAAATLLNQAVEQARAQEDRWLEALAVFRLGSLAQHMGEAERATQLHEASVAMSRQVGEPWLVAATLENLGEALRFESHLDEAEAAYAESLEISRWMGDTRGTSSTLCDLGRVALERRESSRAAKLFIESLELAERNGWERRVIMALEGLAGVAVVAGDAGRATRLCGATQRWRDETGTPWEPPDRASYGHELASARAALGTASFEEALEAGRQLSLGEAIQLALAKGGQAPTFAATGALACLTPRERQVAALIAEGLTNRQIADRLVISERTVDNHTANILSKLGLSTRARVAVWAAEHGLLENVPASTAWTTTNN